MARIKSAAARSVAVAYARVSTPGQATEGVSLEQQEAGARAGADHGTVCKPHESTPDTQAR